MKLVQLIRSFQECVSNDKYISILEIYKEIIHNSKLYLGIITCFSVVGLIVCFSIPREYRSSVTIALEVQSSPVNLGNSFDLSRILPSNKDAINVSSYPELVLNAKAIETLLHKTLPSSDKTTKITDRRLEDIILYDNKKPWWKQLANIMTSILQEEDYKREELYDEMKRRILVSTGKSNEVLVIETMMQDPLTAAALCDTVVNFLNTQLESIYRRNIESNLVFVETQTLEKKETYYTSLLQSALFKDSHHNLTTNREKINGIFLSNEAQMNKEDYIRTYREYLITKIQNNSPHTRFFTAVPAQVALKPTWPKKASVLFLFVAEGFIMIIISGTLRVMINTKKNPDET